MSGWRLRFAMVAVGLTLGPVADGAAPAATCRDLNYFGLSGVAFDTMEACQAWAAGLNGVLLQCSGSAGGFQCQARAGEVLLGDPDNCVGALASVEGTLTDFAGQGSPIAAPDMFCVENKFLTFELADCGAAIGALQPMVDAAADQRLDGCAHRSTTLSTTATTSATSTATTSATSTATTTVTTALSPLALVLVFRMDFDAARLNEIRTQLYAQMSRVEINTQKIQYIEFYPGSLRLQAIVRCDDSFTKERVLAMVTSSSGLTFEIQTARGGALETFRAYVSTIEDDPNAAFPSRLTFPIQHAEVIRSADDLDPFARNLAAYFTSLPGVTYVDPTTFNVSASQTTGGLQVDLPIATAAMLETFVRTCTLCPTILVDRAFERVCPYYFDEAPCGPTTPAMRPNATIAPQSAASDDDGGLRGYAVAAIVAGVVVALLLIWLLVVKRAERDRVAKRRGGTPVGVVILPPRPVPASVAAADGAVGDVIAANAATPAGAQGRSTAPKGNNGGWQAAAAGSSAALPADGVYLDVATQNQMFGQQGSPPDSDERPRTRAPGAPDSDERPLPRPRAPGAVNPGAFFESIPAVPIPGLNERRNSGSGSPAKHYQPPAPSAVWSQVHAFWSDEK